MDDVRAVLDAAGSERAAVLGQGYGCPIAMLFAATHPERVTHLVLYAPTVKAGLRTDDFPWGPTEEERTSLARGDRRVGHGRVRRVVGGPPRSERGGRQRGSSSGRRG